MRTIAVRHPWNMVSCYPVLEDVTTAFLHGILKEEIYLEKTEGHVAKVQEKKVYRLHKSLYGLKQTSRN